MNIRMVKTLKNIAVKFNIAKIQWGVGASLMLHHHGLHAGPHDIDIFVKTDDALAAKAVLDELGEQVDIVKNSAYVSDYFYKYQIDGVMVDLIAGFEIHHDNGVYRYDFDSSKVGKTVNYSGVVVPLCDLGEWYDMYSVMPGGQQKAKSIKKYLRIK